MTSIAQLNSETDEALAARPNADATATPAVTPPAPPAKTARPARKASVPAAAAKKIRKPSAPKAPVYSADEIDARSRAVKAPAPAVAGYVAYLARVVGDGTLTFPDGEPVGTFSPRELRLLALSIKGYGAFQSSPERRAARGA